MPWVYIRRDIAERWHCKPYEIDDAPADEVMLELSIMAIEAECEKH